MLEREFLVRIGAAQKRCHVETGFSFGWGDVCFVNGFCYMARIDEAEEAVRERRSRFVEHARAVAAGGTDLWAAEVRPVVEQRRGQLRRSRLGVRTVAEQVQRLEVAIDAAADAMGNLHWRMGDPSPFDWPATYREITGRSAEEAAVLLAGLGHSTARLVARLRSLARLVQQDERAAEIVAARDLPRLREVAPVHAAFGRLVRDHGRRTGYGAGSQVTFTTPTWSMRPQTVLDIVAAYAGADLDALDHRERRARSDRIALAKDVRARLRGEPDKLAAFNAAYDRAKRRVRISEDSNHLIEQETVGTMRQAVDDTGHWFAGRRILGAPDEVLHLSLDELRELAADPASAPAARELVQARRLEIARLSRLMPPRVLGEPAAPPSAARASESADTTRDELVGKAVAPGRVRGRARVVPMSAEPPDIEPGDVLVAPDAGPAWTPVLAIAGGLVLDRGALDDHAAIMARDLAIPAVVQSHRATGAIPDGSTVEVDGTTGVVKWTR